MRLVLLTLSVLAIGITLWAEEPDSPTAPIRIASWNLENFFDVYDDPWRGDERTKPAFVRDSRKARVAEILKELDADIVCLQEVENRFVLEEFVREYLPESDYEVVLFEGNDKRGIDVGMLSRVPLGPVSSYRHWDYSDGRGGKMRFRRDLLRVRLLGDVNADAYVVHLKSQHGGDEADRVRLAEATAAARILGEELARDPGYRAFIAGDFNDVPDSPTLAVFREAGLVDTCADSKAVTYNQEPYRTRIDFILATPALADAMETATILEDANITKASDHNPVQAVFR